MSGADDPRPRLTLLVTGSAPRSQRARDNLARQMQALDIGDNVLDEIDLIADPGPAVKLGIFASPALVRRAGNQEPAVLYGDLSDEDSLRRFLADLAADRMTDRY